jgi:hypothetical protein
MIFAKPEEKALSSVGLDNPQQMTNILLDKITMVKFIQYRSKYNSFKSAKTNSDFKGIK